MPEETIKSPTFEPDFFKKEAVRSKKICDLQRMKEENVQIDKAVNPFKCLTCMWLFNCNHICIGGCEEYEKRLSAAQ